MKKTESVPRFAEMLELRLTQKWSLQKIGDKYGISREAVRVFLKRRGVVYNKPPTELITRNCLICGKPATREKKTDAYQPLKYCSMKCSGMSRRTNRTIEEQRAVNNVRAKKYYHTVLKFKK